MGSFGRLKMPKLYFAYGSNMNQIQMRLRCPNSEAIASATLKGYRLAINSRGVATIVPDKDSLVKGVVWKISKTDESLLDIFEGVKSGFYKKKSMEIRFANSSVKALIYIDLNSQVGAPRKDYLERIINGAKHFGLGEKYISNLERLAYV